MAYKPIDRRTFLRGSSAMIALPFLEAMLPICSHAQVVIPKRLSITLFPYGCGPSRIIPSGSGRNFNFANEFRSLEAFKADITTFTRIFNHWGQYDSDGNGEHARAQGTYLTAHRIHKSETVLDNGRSYDQIVADVVGTDTFRRLIYLKNPGADWPDSGYSSEYNKISWRDSKTPESPIENVDQAFNALFSGYNVPTLPTTAEQELELKRMRFKKNILDDVQFENSRIKNKLSSTDKQKIEQYLTGINEVQKRIQRQIEDRIAANENNAPNRCDPGQNPGYIRDFPERARTMFDLIALAFQCDACRVIPYMMGSADFGFAGAPGSHHDISHHQGNSEQIRKMSLIATWYAEQFAYFLGKLKEIKEVDDKPMLYHSIATFGSDMSDSNIHDDRHIPLVVAGNAGGAYNPGKLITSDRDVNLANVWLTIMKTMGVQTNSFGSGPAASTGTVDL